MLADDRGDIDRRGAQEDAAAAELDEVHVAVVAAAQEKAQVVAQLAGTARERRRVGRLVFVVGRHVEVAPRLAQERQVGLDQVERAGEAGRRRGRLAERFNRGAHPLFVPHPPVAAMREGELGEERPRVVAEPVEGLGEVVLRLPVLHGEPLDIAGELLEAVVADAEPEVLRRDVLELMGLVEDDAATSGDDLAVRALCRTEASAQSR